MSEPFDYQGFLDQMRLEDGEDTTLYFVKDGNYIKIGVTNGDLDQRVAIMQVGNPRPLTLLGWCHVAADVEPALHQWLGGWCVRGEWFKSVPEVREVVAAFLDRQRQRDKETLERLGKEEVVGRLPDWF